MATLSPNHNLTVLSDDDRDMVHRLRQRAWREKTGHVIVEGVPEVTRALKAGVPLVRLFLCPGILPDFNLADDVRGVSYINKDDFARIAFGDRLKGVLGIFRPEQKTLQDLPLSDIPLIVVCESVEKPGNLGTVIRTADGVGVDAVINCDPRTDVYNHHVVRSSIGTVFHVPAAAADRKDVLNWLQAKRIGIYAASARAEKCYTEVDWTQPAAIILGNEHGGVSEEFLKAAKETIRIPMQGESGSLNVSVSAAVILYEALRQRTRNKKGGR